MRTPSFVRPRMYAQAVYVCMYVCRKDTISILKGKKIREFAKETHSNSFIRSFREAISSSECLNSHYN